MEGSVCKVTEVQDEHVFVSVAFLHFSTNVNQMFSSVFASPFTHLLYFFNDVFDSVKII